MKYAQHILLACLAFYGALQTVEAKTCTSGTVTADCPTANLNLAATPTCTGSVCDCLTPANMDATTAGCAPKAPTLTVTATNVADLSVGGEYTFVCTPGTAIVGETFKIYMGTTEIGSSTTTGMVAVTVASTSAGAYTCTSTLNAQESAASAAITVAVGAAGRYCTANADCVGINDSGTCVTTTKRCACKDGFTAIRSTCGSGAVPMATFSVVTFLTAFIVSRLF